MDLPAELLDEQGFLPGSGRGRGISIFQPERPASSVCLESSGGDVNLLQVTLTHPQKLLRHLTNLY